MKYLSTIISLLLVVGQGVAQNIEGNFQYRVGDVMRKQVVDYMVDTIAAKNRVWNLQDLEFLDGRRKVIFDSVYNRSELVSYVEKNTRYFFE